MSRLVEPTFNRSDSHGNSVLNMDVDMDRQDFESPENNRRRSKRFSIQAPAVGRIQESEILAVTRNVSTCGAYLSVRTEEDLPRVGDVIDLVIKVPPTIGSVRPSFITGRGRITRTEERQLGETGIALEILDFVIQRELSSGVQDADNDTDPGMQSGTSTLRKASTRQSLDHFFKR